MSYKLEAFGQMKRILLILFAILTMSATAAPADPAPQDMNEAALASYISGRLSAVLTDSHQVTQSCDSTGCTVVVQ
jgi:hypothetical protein